MVNELEGKLRIAVITLLMISILIGTIFFIKPSKPEEKILIEQISIGTFKSIDEIESYIKSTTQAYGIMPSIMPFYGGFAITEEFKGAPVPMAPARGEVGGLKYSKTNVQVEGVDEADIVKTNGEYIFLASNNELYIIKAYPPSELKIISKMKLNNFTRIAGLFITQNRLILLCESFMRHIWVFYENRTSETQIVKVRMITPNTTTYMYDISNPKNPKLINYVNVTGRYVTSRLIDNYIYVIVSQPSIIGDKVFLPIINGKQVSPSNIKYFGADIGYSFTTILAINTENGEYNEEVFLTGYSSHIYVSLKNLYILSRRWIKPIKIMNKALSVIMPLLPNEIKSQIEKINKMNITLMEKYYKIGDVISNWINKLPKEKRKKFIEEIRRKTFELMKKLWREETAIYKFRLNGLNITAIAIGTVPGYVLDQFSMDEYNGYFRIATTITKHYPKFETSNNVYILDENLNITGKVEDLAIGERIYAARYMGNIMFLVTFRRIDPLFGIDLSDPRNPKVIGYLKIPGYSEYLHPYKDKYLIGIGMDADETGRIKGMKVSLFDISNLKNIKEISSLSIGNGYAWSPILSDHKAFMINLEKNYFAIPVMSKVSESGVYIIDIIGEKLSLRGIIPHINAQRSLYIEDYIYTFSFDEVKVVNENLEMVNQISLESLK